MKEVEPYGAWTSPLDASTVAANALRLTSVAVDGDDVYWLEGRPSEGGRGVIVKRNAEGRIADVTPAGTNVRTRVHEYGGGAYIVSESTIYFSEFADQRLYRLAPNGVPEPLTPPGDWYYADCTLDRFRRRLVCVREDHTKQDREAVTTLASIPLDGPMSGDVQVLVSGHDFYATPRLSPDGTRLSWLAWRHPQMPWDGTELWVAHIASDGTVERPVQVAGSETESVYQPGWSPDGTLYFVSDRSGWWNLCRWRDDHIETVHGASAEFGRPMWTLGACTWAFADPSRLVVTYVVRGRWHLGLLDLSTATLAQVAAEVEPAETLAATSTHAVIVGGSSSEPDAVLRIDLATGAVERIRQTSSGTLPANFVSVPRAIEFPTEHGLTAHAFYYAPRNPRFAAPPGERPPLIVISHGGPTSAANARLNLEMQYWTSRGFGVVDVNYGGSTAYGRAYRRRLDRQWGIVDVDDCANAARYLVAEGEADGRRLIIRGRSAGGYTTLAALTFRPDVFQAGTSYYGVGDLERLASDTHKFESRYLDGLVGPYPASRDLYRQRSPIHFVDRLSCPLLLFQGLEDLVVPPNQAEAMAEAVRARGLPVALVTFEGEQHGFRKAATIVRCLEIELFFYGAVFGFTPAGTRPDFAIDNLHEARSG